MTFFRPLPSAFLCAGILLATADPALARWTDAERPMRAEMPVDKSAEIPRFKDSASDPTGDTFGAGTVQLDLVQITADVVGSDFVVALGFNGAISAPDSGQNNALDGYIDLDLDQDGTTGRVPWSDLLRLDGGATGMGNEAYVDLRTYDGSGNVELIEDASGTVLGRVALVLGTSSAEVQIPLALLDGDRSADVAAIIGTLTEATDVAPNQGSVASSDGTSAVLLQGDRFRVDVGWAIPNGDFGIGRVVEQSEDSSVFYFFQPSNWELMVKVLDGCDVNGQVWVFISGSTDVEYSVEVTDTATGINRVYGNPLGQTAVTVTDTSAFDACP
ncbi:MAG: hypothetical protein AAGM22_13450 [Acidobacteriota bacterium]